jgi:uncharacterized protein (TIGR00251 family)
MGKKSFSPMTSPWIQEIAGGISLRLRILPRSSRNEIIGLRGDRLCLKLTAPPVEGEANKACKRFISETLGVPLQAVDIVSGEKSKDKVLKIKGDSQCLLNKLKHWGS